MIISATVIEYLRGRLIVSYQTFPDKRLFNVKHITAIVQVTWSGGAFTSHANGTSDSAAIRAALPEQKAQTFNLNPYTFVIERAITCPPLIIERLHNVLKVMVSK